MTVSHLFRLIIPMDSRINAPTFILSDHYTTARAAGAVDGTAAEPTGGNRSVIDTLSKLTIASDSLTFATGGAAEGDPLVKYATVAREAGRAILANVRITGGILALVLSSSATLPRESVISMDFTNLVAQIDKGTGSFVNTSAIAGSTNYKIAVVLRTNGEFVFLKGGAYTYWSLLYWDPDGGTDPLTPMLSVRNTSTVATADLLRIPVGKYIPVPLVSDTFSTTPTARDKGESPHTGAHTAVGLNGSQAYYDGTNAYTNVYTTGLASGFNGNEGTLIARTKVSSWNDGSSRVLAAFWVDVSGRVQIEKTTTGTVTFRRSSSASKTITRAMTESDNVVLGMTWSVVADEFKAYFNGSQTGSTQTGIGTISTNPLASDRCIISGEDTLLTQPWVGYIGPVLLARRAATSAEMSSLNTTFTIANAREIFGGQLLAFWSLAESYTSDGLAIAESGGSGVTWTSTRGEWVRAAGNVAKCVSLSSGLGMRTVSLGTADVLIEAELTRSGGDTGLVLRYNDSNNYVVAVHDGTDAGLVKVIGGVSTVVYSLTIAYAATAPLRVVCYGSTFIMYYNGTRVGTDTISDAAVQTTKLFGLYTSNVGNTFDGVVIFARGTSNEHERLDVIYP